MFGSLEKSDGAMRSKQFLLIVMSATSCSRAEQKREKDENESERKDREYRS